MFLTAFTVSKATIGLPAVKSASFLLFNHPSSVQSFRLMIKKMLFSFFLLSVSAAFSQDRPDSDPKRVLFIGNSYTQANKLSEVIKKMAAALPETQKLEIQRHTPGGCTFEKHIDQGQAAEKIESFRPHFVVLQEQSQMPFMHPERTQNGARALHKLIKAAGAHTVFYMTWAREHQPGKIIPLSEIYLGLGEELDATVAPVGLAWQRALKEHPEWTLHAPDKSHPAQTGSYLAACVILHALTDADIAALPDEPFGLNKVTDKQAAYFQSLGMKQLINLPATR